MRQFERETLAPLRTRLPPAFVCDLFVPMENERARDGLPVTIIEINPFYHKTGACLFDWTKDRDLLLRGDCEVRYLKEPLSNAALAREFGSLRDEVLVQEEPNQCVCF